MWYWDFGDGSTGSLTGAPTHTYTNPGTYTVTMTASNMYGSDTITETDLITVNGQVINNGAIFAQSIPARSYNLCKRQQLRDIPGHNQ